MVLWLGGQTTSNERPTITSAFVMPRYGNFHQPSTRIAASCLSTLCSLPLSLPSTPPRPHRDPLAPWQPSSPSLSRSPPLLRATLPLPRARFRPPSSSPFTPRARPTSPPLSVTSSNALSPRTTRSSPSSGRLPPPRRGRRLTGSRTPVSGRRSSTRTCSRAIPRSGRSRTTMRSSVWVTSVTWPTTSRSGLRVGHGSFSTLPWHGYGAPVLRCSGARNAARVEPSRVVLICRRPQKGPPSPPGQEGRRERRREQWNDQRRCVLQVHLEG
jgi:hypothetical protein